MAYFPMFIDLKGKNCLVVGGGPVAERKVRVMLDFGLKVTVAAPFIQPRIVKEMPVECVFDEFAPEMLDGREIVIAATDDKAMNSHIAKLCKDKGIPVNAVDSAEDSDFIFPSYIKKGDVVAAFSSSGQSPVVTQYLKEKNGDILTEGIGEIAEYLGSIRSYVRSRTEYESQRAVIYREILDFFLREERLPQENETEEIIRGVIK